VARQHSHDEFDRSAGRDRPGNGARPGIDLKERRKERDADRDRKLLIAIIAATESPIARDEMMAKAKADFGWKITSIRAEVDKARKLAQRDAMKQKPDADAEEGAGAKFSIMEGPEAVALFNANYAVIRVGGKVRILFEDDDADGRKSYALLTEKDFKTHSANKGVVVIPGEEKDAYVPANDYWLQSPDRREYSGLVFRPGEEMKVAPGSNWPWPKFYNLWRGWGVDPSEKGSCERFKGHLREEVCGGDLRDFEWLWKFLSHIFQKPMEKPGVAVAIKGPKGGGKTIIGEILGTLVGRQHYAPVSRREHLIGKFNAHTAYALVILAEEALWVHEPGAVGIMKDLITTKRRALEAKGFDVVMVDAYDRLIMDSNEDTMIPAEAGERRYFALNGKWSHIRDIPYFDAMFAELNAGGYERLMWEFLQTDLSDFDCRTCPETEALAEQKKHNLPFVEKWMLDCLLDGALWNAHDEAKLEGEGDADEGEISKLKDASELFTAPMGCLEMATPVVLKDTVWDDYLKHCQAMNHRQHLCREQLSKKLQSHLGFKLGRQRCRMSIYDRHNKRIHSAGDRVQVFILPTLEEARSQFLKATEINKDTFDE
jgi:hypothetical protein